MALSTDDIVAIEQLYARYNHSLDFGNVDAWVDCFTEDGVFATGNGSHTGPEELRGFATGFAQNMGGKMRHWNTNLLLEPTADGASGSVYLLGIMTGGERGTLNALMTAVYRDELTKESGEWRFRTRTVIADS